jgi:hypothetical protein
VLAAALFLVGVAALEGFWRSRGHQPSVADDLELWSHWRERVYGPDKLVLVGGSRMLLGVSLDELRRRLPHHQPIQLAIGASQPGAVLRDLAEDPDFAGVVIADMWGAAFESTTWQSQQEYVDYFHQRWNWERRIERRLETPLQERLVLLDPALGLPRIAEVVEKTGALPQPYYITTRADRSRAADFTLRHTRLNDAQLEAVAERQRRRFGVSTPDEWLRQAAIVDGWSRRITARGGRVVWVHFPSAGASWRQSELSRPKARYWDRLHEVAATPTLHFLDVAALGQFVLPDDIHLDQRDAQPFTSLLVDELLRMGVLRSAAGDGGPDA